MKKNRVILKIENLDLLGEIYFPDAANQPCPALCLCHGIPAEPQNPDDTGYPLLAEKFCSAGFVTLIFNFRGTGQSQGNLDLFGWTQDIEAAIDFLFSLDEVNKSSLSLLGFSGGAAVSVYVTAHDPRISSVVACACPAEFNFLLDEQQSKTIIDRFRSIGVIRDKEFPPSLDEWFKGFNKVSPIQWIEKISPRSLLLIHGDKDEVVSIDHAYRLYEQAKEPKELVIIPGAGHRLRLEEEAMNIALSWLTNKD